MYLHMYSESYYKSGALHDFLRASLLLYTNIQCFARTLISKMTEPLFFIIFCVKPRFKQASLPYTFFFCVFVVVVLFTISKVSIDQPLAEATVNRLSFFLLYFTFILIFFSFFFVLLLFFYSIFIYFIFIFVLFGR